MARLDRFIKITTCTCGHPLLQHDGACVEPTGRCGCLAYEEMCPICRHPKTIHEDGSCARVKLLDRALCGCAYYPAESGS